MYTTGEVLSPPVSREPSPYVGTLGCSLHHSGSTRFRAPNQSVVRDKGGVRERKRERERDGGDEIPLAICVANKVVIAIHHTSHIVSSAIKTARGRDFRIVAEVWHWPGAGNSCGQLVKRSMLSPLELQATFITCRSRGVDAGLAKSLSAPRLLVRVDAGRRAKVHERALPHLRSAAPWSACGRRASVPRIGT